MRFGATITNIRGASSARLKVFYENGTVARNLGVSKNT